MGVFLKIITFDKITPLIMMIIHQKTYFCLSFFIQIIITTYYGKD